MRALTNLQLLVYGLPGLPLAVLLLPLFVIIPTFYADDLGLGLATVGGILFFARIWDVITDPLIGVLSDRTASRFGRRKPWLVLGTPIAVVGAWALFLPPEQVSAAYLLFATIALYLGGTMIMLPYTAWAAELSPHNHERSAVAAQRAEPHSGRLHRGGRRRRPCRRRRRSPPPSPTLPHNLQRGGLRPKPPPSSARVVVGLLNALPYGEGSGKRRFFLNMLWLLGLQSKLALGGGPTSTR